MGKKVGVDTMFSLGRTLQTHTHEGDAGESVGLDN